MKEVIAKVTRKGQVTIPVEFRKARGIKEGSKVSFRQSASGLVLEPIPNIEDLAGVDAQRIGYKQAVKELDRMRTKDRY